MNSRNTNRKKHEKFEILDSPQLLKHDFQQPIGPNGRALLYLDIDHFKNLNTKHTETLIDKTVLPAFQNLLRDILEPYSFIYAEGGDEVVILLNNCSAFLACAMAENVRVTLEEKVFYVGENTVSLTASIGVAHSSDHGDGADLQLKANEAKSFSKKEGRNRTSIALPDKIEQVKFPKLIFDKTASNVISRDRLRELSEEEDTVISEYISRPDPFFSFFYCAGHWKPNPFMKAVSDDLRAEIESQLSVEKRSRVPRVRRSIILFKALDSQGQPCLLHYFSGRPMDGWMTWLLPNIDRDVANYTNDFMEVMSDNFKTLLGLENQKITINDLNALSICIKTNPHANNQELRAEPKFYAFRYYYATISDLPEKLRKRSITIPQGSFERRLRWFYAEELASGADDNKIMQANADVLKTIRDVCTTLLVTFPEASPGARIESPIP